MFDDVTFEDSRFDPDLSVFHDMAKAMATGFGYTADLRIPRRLAALLRLRVAQLNPCVYCLTLHTKVAENVGVPTEVIAHLPGWRESGLFSAEEKAALDYTEALTTYDHVDFGHRHLELRQHFAEALVAEIAAVVINMNVWTRLKLAQGATPRVKAK